MALLLLLFVVTTTVTAAAAAASTSSSSGNNQQTDGLAHPHPHPHRGSGSGSGNGSSRRPAPPPPLVVNVRIERTNNCSQIPAITRQLEVRNTTAIALAALRFLIKLLSFSSSLFFSPSVRPSVHLFIYLSGARFMHTDDGQIALCSSEEKEEEEEEEENDADQSGKVQRSAVQPL